MEKMYGGVGSSNEGFMFDLSAMMPQHTPTSHVIGCFGQTVVLSLTWLYCTFFALRVGSSSTFIFPNSALTCWSSILVRAFVFSVRRSRIPSISILGCIWDIGDLAEGGGGVNGKYWVRGLRYISTKAPS